MIVDRIENLSRYGIPMGKEIASYLQSVNPQTLALVEAEIHGRELFVRPSEYTTRLPEDGKFETHRVYADLQYVVSGAEVMQTALSGALTPLADYDPASDCQFFRTDKGVSDIVVSAGGFAVFFPGEPHRPCCHYMGTASYVKKLVFKIRV